MPRPKIADEVRKRRGALLRALAERFDMIQTELADRSGGILSRTQVNKGWNDKSTVDSEMWFTGIGHAVRLNPVDVEAYFIEDISLDELASRQRDEGSVTAKAGTLELSAALGKVLAAETAGQYGEAFAELLRLREAGALSDSELSLVSEAVESAIRLARIRSEERRKR